MRSIACAASACLSRTVITMVARGRLPVCVFMVGFGLASVIAQTPVFR
jgi:hypothetical protein